MTMRGWSEMVVESILRRARALGIRLEAVGEHIRYAPKSLAPEDFVESLRKHKPEILSYLSRSAQSGGTDDTRTLLAWATGLAEEGLVLGRPIRFVETPLRVITTTRISYYAAEYLKTISRARMEQPSGGWGMFTSSWWSKQEEDAMAALASLKEALAQQDAPGGLS
jgi:hypothetical protein